MSWPLHYLNPLCLEPRCCSLTDVFGIVIHLLKQPFQGHFLFGIRQHNLFKNFDVCATMLHCLISVMWPEFSTRGSSDLLSKTTRPEKNNYTLISPQNVTTFVFGPIKGFLGKFLPFLHMLFFQQRCFTGGSC